ncbi:MAG: SPOR domain-containing protein [Bdellovibrionales bacterium]|nr:SPOR domain-containing protein [Bdellovibrionales bacterium]
MLNQAGGTQADTIVKLVLIFFISLLSFSVGTFVGKQVSDSDYKRAALEEDYQSFRQADAGDEHGKESGEKVSEEELSSLTEEFVNKEKAAASKEAAPRGVASTKEGHAKTDEHAKADDHGKPEAKETEAKVTATADQSGYKKYSKGQPTEAFVARDEVKKKELAAYREKLGKTEKAPEHSAAAGSHGATDSPGAAPAAAAPVTNEAQRVAEGKAPTADPAKVRTPTSVLPSVATSSVGKYTVQVASYATEDEAKAHAAELKTKGWNSFYLPADIKGRTWYRVSIGLFADQKSATSFREELMKQSSISSAIVQKIVQ